MIRTTQGSLTPFGVPAPPSQGLKELERVRVSQVSLSETRARGTPVTQSMLAALPNGTLLAAWQGSSGLEGGEDQRIWMATSLDPLGKEWEPPSPLPHRASHARTALWSPVLHCDTAGTLWLFYAESKAKCLRGEGVSRVVRPPLLARLHGPVLILLTVLGTWKETST